MTNRVDIKLFIDYKGKTYEAGADVNGYKNMREMVNYIARNIEDTIRLEEVKVSENKD